MSIIKSPYEISLWKDEIDNNGLPVEKKICVIGSDKMNSQSRAFSPNFSRGVNGQKKLTFNMYKWYIDTVTGDKVSNPFIGNLINEAKIKLYYENKWYDFIIKDINENSSTHLCTYTLEDALVKELSKNGFNVVLDAALQNNLGNVQTLAKTVLAETDWKVKSEVFVEKVEEALVYIQTTKGMPVQHIIDQQGFEEGVSTQSHYLESGSKILAFYSCCKNKPYRFQFIYNENGYDKDSNGKYGISRKDTRIIDEKDCQYYIDITTNYIASTNNSLEIYLPDGFECCIIGAIGPNGETDSVLSSWYRGERYGYAQQSVYVPMLEKYCQKFVGCADGEDYLGYVDTEFVSPTLVQNYINNYDFKTKNGWYTAPGKTIEEPEVANVYGRFQGGFSSVIDEFYNAAYDNKASYKPYMKMVFTNTSQFILNSGLKDNRTMIKNISKGEEWILDYKLLDSNGRPLSNSTSLLQFSIGEYAYDSSTGDYNKIQNSKITYTTEEKAGRIIFKITSSDYTEKTFKKSKFYLAIKARWPGTYYFEQIALFRKALDKNGEIIVPDFENKESKTAQYYIDTGVIKNQYHFFREALVRIPEGGDDSEIVNGADELVTEIYDEIDYNKYLPVYNLGAEKIRTVAAKESNYFNILQSIAETFECWLELEIARDDFGGIKEKKVAFKNYIGENNYANFRYGVNLKEIQRTTNSKNITTKLIVKQNSNQLGKDGFCTIQRAGANPLGENYIYDFQYYHNQGLMDVNEYLRTVYYLENGSIKAEGPDAELWDSGVGFSDKFNLNGYALRVKKINEAIRPISEEVAGLNQALIDKQAELEVAQATLEAAQSELEEIRDDFQALTGVYPEESSPSLIQKMSKGSNLIETDQNWWSISYTESHLGLMIDDKKIKVSIYPNEIAQYERIARLKLNLDLEVQQADGTITNISRSYEVKVIVPAGVYVAHTSKDVGIIDADNSSIQKYLTNYTTCLETEKSSKEKVGKLEPEIGNLKTAIKDLQKSFDKIKEYKRQLNELFFQKYGRFITEGTWINEEYIDDDKYYTDAQSVLYNSCYPQVTYNINVLFLSKLPGYELFKFELGDTTKVIDDEFFGKDKQQEVVITEISEQLDDPSQNTIKVQTFKNQFQNLFQKITATTQQTEYNVGSYEKGAKLVEANTKKKSEFITNAINSAQDYLKYGQTVKSGPDGITITDSSDKQSQLRLVGGAILFSTTDPETQEQTWRTGLTNEGISADLITAGRIDAGIIQIMSGDDPVFRWDAYGISAYDAYWGEFDGVQTITGIDTTQFVRFDKYGIYGINKVADIDGARWHPNDQTEIDAAATFALTWEGLKVTGEDGIEARIGKNAQDGSIIKIVNGEDVLLAVSNDGNLEMAGKVTAKSGKIGGFILEKWYDLENTEEDGYVLRVGGDPSKKTFTQVDYADGQSEWVLKMTEPPEIFFCNVFPAAKLALGGSKYKNDWRLGIGNNFGVDKDGNVYASNANLSGHIDATTGTLHKLSIEGTITLANDGEIAHNDSNCRWTSGGIKMGGGQIGCWHVINGLTELDNAFLQAKGQVKLSSNQRQTEVRLEDNNLTVHVLQKNDELNGTILSEEWHQAPWYTIAKICTGELGKIACWEVYKDSAGGFSLISRYDGYVAYLEKTGMRIWKENVVNTFIQWHVAIPNINKIPTLDTRITTLENKIKNLEERLGTTL